MSIDSRTRTVLTRTRFTFNLTLMALPGILFFFIFSYLPMIGIIVAFKDFNFRDGILFSPWNGIDNFRFFFRSKYAFRITANTLLLNGLFIVIGTVFQVGFAVILCELRNRTVAKVSNTVMFLSYFISWVIVGYFSYAFLNVDHGLVNKVFRWAGLPGVDWYNTPDAWPAILVICYLWRWCGYGSVIFTAGIMGINPEYYEAAIMDGAGKWQQLVRITLPLLRPLVVILTLLAIGRIFYADFGMFYYVTQNSGPLYSRTDVMDTFVFRAIRVTGDFGMASAAGFIQAVMGFLLVLISNQIVRRIDAENRLF